MQGLEKAEKKAQIALMDDKQKNQDGAAYSPTEQESPKRATAAGGVFIALGTIFGTIFGGFAFGQPSAGFIVGLIGGALVAVFIALNDNIER